MLLPSFPAFPARLSSSVASRRGLLRPLCASPLGDVASLRWAAVCALVSRALSAVCCFPSSVFWLPSPVFYLPSSIFCIPSSVFYRLPSLICHLPSASTGWFRFTNGASCRTPQCRFPDGAVEAQPFAAEERELIEALGGGDAADGGGTGGGAASKPASPKRQQRSPSAPQVIVVV